MWRSTFLIVALLGSAFAQPGKGNGNSAGGGNENASGGSTSGGGSSTGGGSSNGGGSTSGGSSAGGTAGGSSSAKALTTASGSQLEVLGQSGKMKLSGVGGSDEPVTITMDYIREVDGSGNEVGKSGPNSGKHSRETFASTSFTFGQLTDTTVPGADDFPDVAAKSVEFSVGLIDGAAKLTVQALLFTEEGTIKPNDVERYNVSDGTLKFNVVVENWPFCTATDSGNPCNNAVGEFVDFGVAITGPAPPAVFAPEDAATPAKDPYALGAGAEFILSNRVRVDGTWENMAEGYPKVSSDGTKYLVALRLPKHTSEALYDPVVRSAGSASSTSTGSDGSAGSSGSNKVSQAFASLSPGEIAGVTIGCAVVAALLAFAIYKLCSRLRAQRAPDTSEASSKDAQSKA